MLALSYELGVSILGLNLVWIQGPYPTGKYTNIKIINMVLCHCHCHDPDKRVDADEGYAGHPNEIKCPNNVMTYKNKWGVQAWVWAYHQMLNGCLKTWGILCQVYRHDILRHGKFF